MALRAATRRNLPLVRSKGAFWLPEMASTMKELLRILLLEDYSADAELIRRELRKGGLEFEDCCLHTREDFLRELERFNPHLIISDFALGQFNALEALDLLRRQDRDLPFVLVTGSQSEEVAVACIQHGADDYILKSSLKRLPSAVVGALKKKGVERDRARAEAALRWSEEHFRSLIENSSDIITIISRDGTINYESPSLERVLGFKPEERIGRNAFEFIHEEDAARAIAMLTRESQPGETRSLEYRVRHKDGSWRFVQTITKNMLETPEIAGIILNSRDGTERWLAEKRVQEQAALLDKAQDAIIVHDLDHRITYWNKSAERLYGWSADEVMGRRIGELLDKQDSTTAIEARAYALQRGEWIGELHQTAKSGKDIIVESRWTLVRNHSGSSSSILLINTDITDRKKLEGQFLRVQRMESIGTLAGGIAHDLNNVLAPIVLAIRLLREDVQSTQAHAILNTLETSAHRGASIVQQVLSFARGVEGEKSVFQVKHPLSEIVSMAKDTFPKSIQITTRLTKDLWPIFGDPTQLHQVFLNLCVNARDALPQGGRLSIEAENIVIDENYARMQPEAKVGPYVVVTVADTGIGMPPAVLGKIFEPFFTTKEVGKGTGLGLSTVLGIVKNHHGFLNVYSEVGKGTRFKVHLPAAEQIEIPREEPSRVELPRGQGELIIVADDESPIREVIKVTLEANNYHVLTATDGTEAVALYAAHREQIHALIVDVMMPYMDGPTTIRALQKMNPETRFIAVSGLMENDKVAEVPDNGRISFLAKPFTTEQLLMTLRTLLDAA
jgi:PAS domain S-box-containing protein